MKPQIEWSLKSANMAPMWWMLTYPKTNLKHFFLYITDDVMSFHIGLLSLGQKGKEKTRGKNKLYFLLVDVLSESKAIS